MEYGGFSDIFAPETEFMDELFVEGCWVETRVGCGTEASKWNRSMESNGAHIIFEEESEAESLMVGKRWWIGPRGNPGPSSSVKERLVVAVGYLKEYAKNSNMVIQVWVPARRGCEVGIHHHQDFPYTLDYTNNGDATGSFQFHEDWLSDHWPPNIRFLRTHDYTRLHHYDLRPGSLALPVFQRGTGICLGVVDILMPNNVNPDLHNLQGVDFRTPSLQNFIPPAMTVKGFDELYQGALNEIVQVLTCVCKAHELPLALTWAPCIQQGKSGCGHSNDENYVSTVDPACFVADVDVLGFLEACSEYHLLGGQGVVGTAFTTSKPCFANDITAFTKAEYPLAHHANMFGLHAAVAIPLRSVSSDFVLEFFLPKDCHDTQDQKQILNSLSMLVQQACRSLHVVLDKEEEEEELVSHHHHHHSKEMESSSWIAHMMEAQQKGKGVSVSLEYLQEPKQEFKVTTNGNEQVFSDLEGTSGAGVGGRRGGRKSGDKRRTKAEKTISLPVLRQYFAGSLKDAAKSIGVCPTTLKRICRQHGITRWPSRKIKKVGHSLRKLQLVIDSVQGAEGAIQIGSFYTSFPELSSANGVSESPKINSDNSKFYSENGLFSNQGVTSTSSCSQSCNPSLNQSTTLINSNNNNIPEIILMSDKQSVVGASMQVHHPPIPISIPIPIQSLDALPPLPQTSSVWNTGGGTFRVKATFGDEKIRFSLQPNCGFRDLQMEIARRFNLKEMSKIQVKYLDDAQEWVLLTCDADLEECKDINRSSQSRTVRLFLFHASPLNHSTNAFGSTSPT
ncbi:protein NLP2 isoform X1 [Vigna angularis]|uniref:protein NLP2 isoform X1 n=1 Tax=Phaseolus angularis TaxID=3914 RepID=UPI0022B4F0F9|nr:protein NLP2 isoform X1 [Vigna angularis]